MEWFWKECIVFGKILNFKTAKIVKIAITFNKTNCIQAGMPVL